MLFIGNYVHSKSYYVSLKLLHVRDQFITPHEAYKTENTKVEILEKTSNIKIKKEMHMNLIL